MLDMKVKLSYGRTLISLSFIMLSACTMVGPDFKAPPVRVADHWQGYRATAKEMPPQDAHWWDTFHDPTLASLVKQGYRNNLSLQMAGVRVLQARAQLAQSIGEFYPQQQGLAGNYTYQRIGGGTLNGLIPSSIKSAELGFSSTWEIDFWGKYRRAIQANSTALAASVAAYDDALITLTADIASIYTSIRTDQEKIHITRMNIQLQKESVAITDTRYKSGQTSQLDVLQAETELKETEASLPALRASLQQHKDALAILLGITPGEIEPLLVKGRGIPVASTQVALGIPKDVLRQRPDVHQAMLDAMTQSAAIGAVKANLYPAFSLSGTFAFTANNIGHASTSDIFDWSNHTVTAGPAVSLPLFNYGQITNQVRIQDAAFEQALLKYQNVVLQAQQEVQDNIAGYVQAQKAVKTLSGADGSARKSSQLALIRYKEDQTIYTTVLDAEKQQLQIELSLMDAKNNSAQFLIALYRSLGGGWQIRGNDDVVPQHIKAQMAARTNWGELLNPGEHQPHPSGWQYVKQHYLPNW